MFLTDFKACLEFWFTRQQQDKTSTNLVGFSYGGPIAVEMARILSERDGTSPPLILLDPHAVWNDSWRWSRRALKAAKTGNVSRLWNLGKMYASATSNGETDDLEEAHLVPWLSYKPAPLPLKRGLFVRSTDPTARTNAEAWSNVFSGRLDVADASADHTSMMMHEPARMLAQTLQSWMQTSNAH
ncbi:MAG: thioesterase domain-containing protein [Pseudomonadota bacterium]